MASNHILNCHLCVPFIILAVEWAVKPLSSGSIFPTMVGTNFSQDGISWKSRVERISMFHFFSKLSKSGSVWERAIMVFHQIGYVLQQTLDDPQLDTLDYPQLDTPASTPTGTEPT